MLQLKETNFTKQNIMFLTFSNQIDLTWALVEDNLFNYLVVSQTAKRCYSLLRLWVNKPTMIKGNVEQIEYYTLWCVLKILNSVKIKTV